MVCIFFGGGKVLKRARHMYICIYCLIRCRGAFSDVYSLLECGALKRPSQSTLKIGFSAIYGLPERGTPKRAPHPVDCSRDSV